MNANQIKPSHVEFEDSHYRVSHGHGPRGRGGWGFCPTAKYFANDYLAHVFWANGTFAEARAAAAVHFMGLNIIRVTVCS